MVTDRFFRFLLPGILLLWLALLLSNCNVFPKAQDSLANGISQGIIQSRVDSLLKASADSVLNQVFKTERFQMLRREYGGLLKQTTDSLYHATDTILNAMLHTYTDNWLIQMDTGLLSTLDRAKASLTDDQLKNYITSLISRDLSQALNQLIDRLGEKIRSPEFKYNIADLRRFLDLQVDSLSRSATRGAVAVLNDSLLPRIDRLLDKLVAERDKTQRGVASIVWIILIGIVAIILIGFLIRALYMKLRYQKMLKLITGEVDKIDSQPVYDRLVHNVSEKMKSEGLEETLRKDILDQQGLIDQPEWQNKDNQLLEILVQELKDSNLSEAQIRDKLREKGLEEHYDSRTKNLNPLKP
ncbi:MAG: hypothetical protein ABIP44_07140 [Pseudoxanthomonas sp.]